MVAYATLTGRVTYPGISTGIPGQITATPLTEGGVLALPDDDRITVGPASTDVTGDGSISPALNIPVDGPAAGVLWRLVFVPKGKGKLPVRLGDYAITGSGDIADLVPVQPTVITPTMAAKINEGVAALSGEDTAVAFLIGDEDSEVAGALSATIGTATRAFAPILFEDFTTRPNTTNLAGSRAQSGHELADRTIRPSGKFKVVGGYLVSDPEVGQTNAGYLGARLPGTAGQNFVDATFTAATGQLIAVIISADSFVDGVDGEPYPDAVHCLFSYSSWSGQVYETGTGPDDIASGGYTLPDGVECRFTVTVDGDTVRMTVVRNDNNAALLDTTFTDSRISDYAGEHVTIELFNPTNASPQTPVLISRWGATVGASRMLPASRGDVADAVKAAATRTYPGSVSDLTLTGTATELVSIRTTDVQVGESGRVVMRASVYLEVSASGDGAIFAFPYKNDGTSNSDAAPLFTLAPTLTSSTGWKVVEILVTGLTPGARYSFGIGFSRAGTGAAKIKVGSDGAYARFPAQLTAAPA